MASTEGKDEAPVPMAAPTTAPAVTQATATRVADNANRNDSDSSICVATCWFVVIFISFLGVLFFGFVGLAYVDIFPGSLMRPYFFDSPYALTKSNWDEKTAGRTVFIKFYAPWCGHCKKIAPFWDKLAAQHVDHSFLEVGEVDCTASSGKPLCTELGISGFPTLKYGDPNNLQDYKGGRTFEDLSKFAAELKPTCSPGQLDSCSEDETKMIEEFQAMSPEKREARIAEQEAELTKLQAAFKEFVDNLSTEYKESTTKKENAVKAVKDGGLAMLKAILAHESAPQDASAKNEDPKKDDKSEL